MNRFEKFLEVTGIAAGHRHSAAERASYFLWYHTKATREREADLEVLAAYLKESGTSVPDLHDLYHELTGPHQLVSAAPIPGRLRMHGANGLDAEYAEAVFGSMGLSPLYFWRRADGTIVRVGSKVDELKYWPQRSWVAAWVMFGVGIAGGLLALRP